VGEPSVQGVWGAVPRAAAGWVTSFVISITRHSGCLPHLPSAPPPSLPAVCQHQGSAQTHFSFHDTFHVAGLEDLFGALCLQ
jgi:hypothetical protein